MQNKPSTASDKETGQKGKKSIHWKKILLKLKKKNQTIIIKDVIKYCYISPTPFAGSQQEHLALCVHVKCCIRAY